MYSFFNSVWKSIDLVRLGRSWCIYFRRFMPMSARVVYQDIPMLGDSSMTNITEERRKMLIHALPMKALDLDFLNSPLQTLADVASCGQGINDAYRLASGQKENDPVGVPITAPVPLSYAARGKTALQSILSMGEEEGEYMRGSSMQSLLD